MVIPLPAGEAHLWWARNERGDSGDSDDARLASQRALLSDDEKARADRFVFHRDRKLFTMAHALVRSALSQYADVAPRAWQFVDGTHGRPRIRGPIVDDLDFNLSHASGVAVCLVARGLVLGVDVESLARDAPLDVADRYFAPAEVTALRRLPVEQQPRRFFELWTLKESYIKARGLGLTLPLHSFAFALDGVAAPTISFAPPSEDDPAAWQFALLEPIPQYLMATALRQPASVAARIVVRELP
jgi:4'-phosphopantetheinyl transferase